MLVAQGQSNQSRGSSPSTQCCTGAHGQKHGAHKAASAAEKFAARASTLLDAASINKGEWGILVMDAESGEALYEQNADRYFVPASNMKLFTTALALAKLGVDYRFRTTLETQGSVSSEGTLIGDLVLVGRGDPNLSNRKFPFQIREEFDGAPEKVLAELADALARKGVKEISGDIVGDDSYFPRERYPSGWTIDDMVWQYGAAISAIVVDDNTVSLTLTPGEKAGDPARAILTPMTPDFLVENDVVTSAAGVKADLTLTREPGANLVVIKGTLPALSAPRKLVLAVQEPSLHAAALLKQLLEDRGIKIMGAVRAKHDPSEPLRASTVLAEHVSIPLGDSIKLVNKISQNLHTEMLLRTVARQKGIWATPDELAKVPEEFYAAAGIAPGDVIQSDGSGLSRQDLVTPHAIVTLLKYAQTQPWFNAYYDSLPIAGIDGTLEDRMKDTPAAGRVHAKTGSVEHVRTLSGYADLKNGRRVIFSFLSNNGNTKDHAVAQVLDGLCVALVEEFGDHAKESRPVTHPRVM